MKAQSRHSVMSQQYRFRVKEQLDPKLSDWFGGLAISNTPDGNTLLTGEIVDQAALYGIIGRFRDFGVTLISVNPIPVTQSNEANMSTNTFHAEVSHVIEATADELYAIVSDYRVGHPAILPKGYFSELTVLEGGQGAGTVMKFSGMFMGMEVMKYHHTVYEPEPGRLLIEGDDTIETKFIFEPLSGGKQTRVTISTDWKQSPGIKGYVDRLLNPPVARRIYQQELQNLADYARSQRAY